MDTRDLAAILLKIAGLVMAMTASSMQPVSAQRLGFSPGVRVFVVGFFWLVHGLYTWIIPLPLSLSFRWLRAALGAFPVIVVALHWLPLAVCRPHSR